METYKIVGIQKVEFQTDDGKTITGKKFHCVFSSKFVEGLSTYSFFLATDKLPKYDYKLSDNISIEYNRYGKVVCFSKA